MIGDCLSSDIDRSGKNPERPLRLSQLPVGDECRAGIAVARLLCRQRQQSAS